MVNGPRRIGYDNVVLAENRDVELAQVGIDPLRRQNLCKSRWLGILEKQRGRDAPLAAAV